MGFSVEKVQSFTVNGPKRFEYVERTKARYMMQREQWRPLSLPMWNELARFGRLNDLRILCERVEIFVKFADTSWCEFVFDRGFLTDLATVPRFLRGVIDQDDHRILPGVLVHDYLFATRRLPFGYANELFYRMMTANGYPRWRAWLAWVAVSSPAGRRAWKRAGDGRDKWTRTRVGFYMPRPVEIDGKQYKGDTWTS